MENFVSVTDAAAPDDTAPAPPLTDEARAAFGVVAAWCEAQRDDAETTARRQFRTIWGLLVGGLVLLLTLPLIIAYIDHYLGLEESLPPVVVAKAEAAKALLAANQSEMQREVDGATAERDRLRTEIANGKTALAASETALRTAMTSPLALWRKPEIAGLEGIPYVRTWIRTPDGTLIAAGSEGGNVLFLRSTDGVDWTPVQPEAARERLTGAINALMAAPDGTLIAAGASGSAVLLLRSTDGIDWTPVRAEVGLPGAIRALMAAPDGTLFAAGSLSDRGGEKVLLLRSADGIDWTAVQPDERLAGGIEALIAAPDGALIAAGTESGFGAAKVLLLRSTDGVDWTPVRLPVRIPGAKILALTAALNGTLIAAGSLSDRGGITVLFLRSTDGVGWTPVQPEAAGERLVGSIHTLMAAPDGALIAAGSYGRKVLLLRSTDGVDWTPVGLEEAGERLQWRINALTAAPDGTLIAGGVRTGILKSVAATEISGIADSLLDDGVLPPDLIVPAGTAQRLNDIAALRAAIAVLQTQEAQQQTFLDTAEASLTRQNTAVESFETVAVNLDEALRTAEPVRQASRIATRLAIVALLIFLVQIVVNKYRYLQRLAGFYQARAQAFRMLADSDPGLGAALLKGVTATELIASLSPDAIRFDKTAAPPTDNVATLLQSALRRN
ncbi:MAG: WD40 repeat domain-containing protein [Paracoccaceae bacterium]